MADNTTLDPGAGGDTIATDDIGGIKYERVKLTDGTADSTTDIRSGNGTAANALRVSIASDTTGVVAVTDNGSTLSVDDGGGSLTVDFTQPVTVTADVPGLSTAEQNTIADNTVFADGTSKLFPAGFVFDETAGTALTENDAAAGRVDSKRAQVGVIEDATTRGQRAAVSAANALKVDGSAVTQPVSDGAGSLTVDNGGTFVVQENGAALTSLQLNDDPVFADDAAFTVAVSKVKVAGYLADQTATDSVDEGDVGAARMTLDRKQIVTVAPSADTEGLAFYSDLNLTNSDVSIKASAGKLYGYYIYNDDTSEVYVKLYNASTASVTVGSTTPDLRFGIPAGAAANVEFANGIAFSTAITVACTTVASNADATAPTANSVVGNFFYK